MSCWNTVERVYPVGRVAILVDYLSAEGIDPVTALEGTGLTLQQIARPHDRMSEAGLLRCMLNAARLSHDPFIGYRTGLKVHITSLGFLGLAILTCPSVRDALLLPAKYRELSVQLMGGSFEETAGRAIWSFHLPAGNLDDRLQRFLVQHQFAVLTTILRDVMGQKFAPLALHVTCEPPFDARAYGEVFGCEVYFRQPANCLIFDADWLDSVPPYRNVETYQALLSLCDKSVSELKASLGVRGLVRRVVREDLKHSARLDVVARTLAMSTRTLRRRLKEEKTSFRSLVDEVRASLARDHLLDPRSTVDGVAELLGFEHPGNFRRAFVRWTGRTPAQYRVALLRPDSHENQIDAWLGGGETIEPDHAINNWKMKP